MRRLLLLAALALAPVAHAQIFSVYGTYSPAHFSNVATGSVLSGTATYTEQYASYWANGFGGGVTFGILPIGPVRIGLDLRGSTKPGTVGADTAFAGIKVGVKAPLIPIRPYVQISGGYVATRTNNISTLTSGAINSTVGGTFTNKYAAFEGIAGVDYHLVPFIDLRLIEIGAGKGYDTGINFGTTNTQGTLTLFTVNTGIVVHF